MHVDLSDRAREVSEAESLKTLMAKCVHCGFCNATCPTYRVSGDEREGPRGRIYLLKQMLEGGPSGEATRASLDHCLHCQSCETACPSGVAFGEIIDKGRQFGEEHLPKRLVHERIMRKFLPMLLAHPQSLSFFLRLVRPFRSLFPTRLRPYLETPRVKLKPLEANAVRGHVLLLEGCAEPVFQPNIQGALRTLLHRLGYQVHVAHGATCCGALRYHLGDQGGARKEIRQNIEAFEPYLSGTFPELQGQEVMAILVASSGCGAMVEDYARVCVEEEAWAERAHRVSERFSDPLSFLESHVEELRVILQPDGETFMLHEPCTLRHGLKLKGRLSRFFNALGISHHCDAEPDLCCGAGGSSAILYPETSLRLREAKHEALQHHDGRPSTRVSSNIGCMMHLSTPAQPILHWLEVLASRLTMH
jgi:glycolate oxidase iron-sulfur subunit